MQKGKLLATARRAVLQLGDQAASLFSLSSGDCMRGIQEAGVVAGDLVAGLSRP